MSQGPVGWLDEYFLKQAQDGSGNVLPARPIVQYTGTGVNVVDDPTNNRSIVTITAGGGPSQGTTTLSNGLNSNIATGGQSTLRFTGPTAAFSVGGLAQGGTPTAGQTLDVQNMTTQFMTIVHEDASSTAVYRIHTDSGNPIVYFKPGATARFVYDAGNPAGSVNRWRLKDTGSNQQITRKLDDFLGADPTGVGDSTSALQACHDSLPTAGGTIELTDGGNYTISNVTFSKPVRLKMTQGGLTQKTGATGAMLTIQQNFIIDGHSQYESNITANSGQVAVSLNGEWNSALLPGFHGDLGTQVFIARHCNFTGGSIAIDTSAITLFSQGYFFVDHCRFYGQSTYCVNIVDAISFTFVEHNSFSQYTGGALFCGQATETKCYGNMYYPANSASGPAVTLQSSTRVHLDSDIYEGATNYFQPDVLINPTTDAVSGDCRIINCNFAVEREYAWSRSRPRILHYDSGAPNQSTTDIAVLGNYFFAGGSTIVSIGSLSRVSTTVTANLTLHSGQTDSGISTGDKFSLIDNGDSSYNGGPFTATRLSGTQIQWTTTSTGANTGGGLILPGSVAAIQIKSPHGRWLIDNNYFFGYPICVDDNYSYVVDFARDYVGRSVWGPGNRLYGAVGRDVIEFSNGGQYFTRADIDATSGVHPLLAVPRSNETVGLLNRCYNSEVFSAASGMTVTAGQTDPYGTTRASKLTRAGSTFQYLVGVGIGEAAAVEIDLGATYTMPTGPALSYLSFWAKMGGGNPSKCMSVYILGSGGTSLIFQTNVSLNAAWKKYIIPIVWPANIGSIPSNVSNLCFSPGSLDPEPTTCLLFGVSLCDTIPCDYLPTSSVPNQITTLGNRYELGVQMAALTASQAVVTDSNKNLSTLPYATLATASTLVERDASSRIAIKGEISSGTAPTITDVSGTMGSTGTYSLDTGSNDMAGIIKLNPGGSGIGSYTIFQLNFSTTLPGNTPSVKLTLENSSGSWGGGLAQNLSTVIATAVTNSVVDIQASNQHAAAGAVVLDTMPSGSDQLRIAYSVTLK